jgi:hypothetical protein
MHEFEVVVQTKVLPEFEVALTLYLTESPPR